jgi:hypothetical protein
MRSMRRLALAVSWGVAAMVVALVTQSVASNDVAGWLAVAAVGLAAAGILGTGAGWVMSRATRADPASTRVLQRWSLVVVAAAAVAAAALVAQAVLGGAAWGWLAFVAVVALGVASLVVRALHTTS